MFVKKFRPQVIVCPCPNTGIKVFAYTYLHTQPVYNTIVGVQANFRVSYPNRVIKRIKCMKI